MLAVAAVVGAGALQAQSPAASPVAQPASAAPAVVQTTPAARTVTQAPGTAPVATSITQTVYTPQLPAASDLTNAAQAQGWTVEKIVTTPTQVIAFYRDPTGKASTVAYQTLPPSGTAPAPATLTSAPQAVAPTVVVTSPPETVVYETAPRVVYYDTYPAYYSPYYYPYSGAWYPPVSLSFGFGYRSYHGGHYHGHRHR